MSHIADIIVAVSPLDAEKLVGLVLPGAKDVALTRPVPDELVLGTWGAQSAYLLANVNYLDRDEARRRIAQVARTLEFPERLQVLIKDEHDSMFSQLWPTHSPPGLCEVDEEEHTTG